LAAFAGFAVLVGRPAWDFLTTNPIDLNGALDAAQGFLPRLAERCER
jgi:hypothetical protein